jgi:uncharacterized membrane protein YkvA (DUF1232 family)
VVAPCDTIPDFLPLIGFVDDAYVFSLAVRTCRDEIKRFAAWEAAEKQVAEY